MYMKMGIDKIPQIILDTTDRNRTSPFAFTGNKFEFRAVGGSENVAAPMTVLNLIAAEQLQIFSKDLDRELKKGTEKRLAIVNILKKYIKESKKIRFEGDNYSASWEKEAAKRGLSNIKDTPRALDNYLSKKTVDLYEKHGVLVKRELEARNEIRLESYIMKIQIEARIMGDLVLNHIIPTAINYQNKLVQNAKGLKELRIDNSEVVKNIKAIGDHIKNISTLTEKMVQERRKINKIEDVREKAIKYCDNIKGKYFDALRDSVDALELLVDDEDWPLVKYREMLFLR